MPALFESVPEFFWSSPPALTRPHCSSAWARERFSTSSTRHRSSACVKLLGSPARGPVCQLLTFCRATAHPCWRGTRMQTIFEFSKQGCRSFFLFSLCAAPHGRGACGAEGDVMSALHRNCRTLLLCLVPSIRIIRPPLVLSCFHILSPPRSRPPIAFSWKTHTVSAQDKDMNGSAADDEDSDCVPTEMPSRAKKRNGCRSDWATR